MRVPQGKKVNFEVVDGEGRKVGKVRKPFMSSRLVVENTDGKEVGKVDAVLLSDDLVVKDSAGNMIARIRNGVLLDGYSSINKIGDYKSGTEEEDSENRLFTNRNKDTGFDFLIRD